MQHAMYNKFWSNLIEPNILDVGGRKVENSFTYGRDK